MSGWLEKWEQTNYRNMKIASISVFILLAIYMTVIHNFNYLKKVEDLSLFLPSWTFLKECMMVPGGGLIWGGTFLTQFFYYPWLGGAVFIALLLVLQYLVGKAFRIPTVILRFRLFLPHSYCWHWYSWAMWSIF